MSNGWKKIVITNITGQTMIATVSICKKGAT